MHFFETVSSTEDTYVGSYCRWLGIYMFCAIFGAMNIGGLGSLLKLIAFVPIAIWFFQNHQVNLHAEIKASIFFVVWCGLSTVWSIDTSDSVTRTITQVSFLLLLFSASAYEYSEYELDYLKRCLIYSSRITAIIVLLTGNYAESRLVLSGIITENPNYICAYFLFGISGAVINLMSRDKGKVLKIISVIELIIYLYITLATGSRGGLFSVAASAIIIILFYGENNIIDMSMFVRKAVIIIFIIVVMGIVMSYMPAEIASRFTAEAIETSNGTGRYDLWEDSIEAFQDSNFFRQMVGYGTATARDITYLFYFRIHNVIHNIFIESLIEIGVIGLLLYIWHIASFLISAVRRREIFSYSIMIGMIVISVSSSLYAFKPYWNIMLFILCIKNRMIETETVLSKG